VVVRHRDHVDSRRGEQVECGRRGAVVVALAGGLELLGLQGATVGDRGLQVDHRQVGRRQSVGDRPERTARLVQQCREMELEVDVAGEGQRDRPARA